jgi:hypothetical protein
LEVALDIKTFLDSVRSEAKIALSKTMNKVEEVSKVTAIRLKINSKKTQIKDVKKSIGDHIYINRAEFDKVEELNLMINRIQKIEKEIKVKQMQLQEITKKQRSNKE